MEDKINAAQTELGREIRRMLAAGASHVEISRKLKCTSENISYHASVMGLTKRRPSTRWVEIQADLSAGMSPTEVAEKHGIARSSIYQAKGKGILDYHRRFVWLSNLNEAATKLVESLRKQGVVITHTIALEVVREWSE